MLNGDVFVFDNVVHMYDLSDENLARPDSHLDRLWHLRVGKGRRPRGQEDAYGGGDPLGGFARKWTARELGELLFEHSQTDMAMAQAVVLYDVYKEGFSPVRAQREFAAAHPDRVLFLRRCWTRNIRAFRARSRSSSARSLKWARAPSSSTTPTSTATPGAATTPSSRIRSTRRGASWGSGCFNTTRAFPITRARLEDLTPLDIQQAAMDFPDLTFAIHHLALPYFEECVYIAARFENVALVLSGTMHLPLIAPWQFKEYMGRLLRDVGAERILWGSEAPLLGNPQPMLEWFWEMEIDEELQERYGYPPITEEDKRKILGENQARLFGVDAEAKKKEFAAA